MEEMKGAINSMSARMQQTEEQGRNADRRLSELRSDVDGLMDKGAAAAKSSSMWVYMCVNIHILCTISICICISIYT